MTEATLPPKATETRPSRLSSTDIAPFHRAAQIESVSVYWAGGFEMPMPFRVRQWYLAFVTYLKNEVAKQGLRQENFVRFRIAARDHTERFLETSREYQPLAGIAMAPDGKPVTPPTAEDIEQSIKDGGFKLEDWVDDYTYWFIRKQDERQRQDFFGIGGMLLLWLHVDPTTVPPELPIPKPARDYMEQSGHDIEALVKEMYSLQDSFMRRSKEVFGGAIEKNAAFEGIPFVMPLLQARHFLTATPEDLEQWFSVFEGYLIESPEDGGILLAFKDPAFDTILSAVLEQMRTDGLEYPLPIKSEENKPLHA